LAYIVLTKTEKNNSSVIFFKTIKGIYKNAFFLFFEISKTLKAEDTESISGLNKFPLNTFAKF